MPCRSGAALAPIGSNDFAGKTQRRIVSAWIGTAFAEADQASVREQWRPVAGRLRSHVPKFAASMDGAGADL